MLFKICHDFTCPICNRLEVMAGEMRWGMERVFFFNFDKKFTCFTQVSKGATLARTNDVMDEIAVVLKGGMPDDSKNVWVDLVWLRSSESYF